MVKESDRQHGRREMGKATFSAKKRNVKEEHQLGRWNWSVCGVFFGPGQLGEGRGGKWVLAVDGKRTESRAIIFRQNVSVAEVPKLRETRR